MTKDMIPGGKADGKPESAYDQEQIQEGKSVEMEHTDNGQQATEIAKDHLEEIPDYYDRLGEMEDEAKKEEELNLGDPDDADKQVILQAVENQDNLDDDAMHMLFQGLGVEPHEGEEVIYSALQQALQQGAQIDPTQVEERETDDEDEEGGEGDEVSAPQVDRAKEDAKKAEIALPQNQKPGPITMPKPKPSLGTTLGPMMGAAAPKKPAGTLGTMIGQPAPPKQPPVQAGTNADFMKNSREKQAFTGTLIGRMVGAHRGLDPGESRADAVSRSGATGTGFDLGTIAGGAAGAGAYAGSKNVQQGVRNLLKGGGSRTKSLAALATLLGLPLAGGLGGYMLSKRRPKPPSIIDKIKGALGMKTGGYNKLAAVIEKLAAPVPARVNPTALRGITDSASRALSSPTMGRAGLPKWLLPAAAGTAGAGALAYGMGGGEEPPTADKAKGFMGDLVTGRSPYSMPTLGALLGGGLGGLMGGKNKLLAILLGALAGGGLGYGANKLMPKQGSEKTAIAGRGLAGIFRRLFLQGRMGKSLGKRTGLEAGRWLAGRSRPGPLRMQQGFNPHMLRQMQNQAMKHLNRPRPTQPSFTRLAAPWLAGGSSLIGAGAGANYLYNRYNSQHAPGPQTAEKKPTPAVSPRP